MLFKQLSSPLPPEIYSVGYVKKRLKANLYIINYKDLNFEISTTETLEEGEWIRFYGKVLERNIIYCEYVEVLKGVDISMIFKAFEELGNS